MICKECVYYEPEYGTWGVFGWSGDGSKGYCCVEPKRVFVDGKRIRCRYFELADRIRFCLKTLAPSVFEEVGE